MYLLTEVAGAVDFTGVISAITGSINVGQVSTLIAAILGASVGIWLLWMGTKKIIRAISSAFNGRLRV